MERTCRAGHGQLKIVRIIAILIKETVLFIIDERRIRIGKEGITIKESDNSVMILSVIPPTKPAVNPANTPITVEAKATLMPIIKEFRIDSARSRNVSWPKLVVPKKCSREGLRFLG
jgi:hypothetical protein